jgi:uncharacterized protein YjbI with pentapeptide repeats
MPVWAIALIGFVALAGTVVPGVRLWWPTRVDPLSRRDLGLALMTGALIAFSVLLLQLLFDIRLAQSDHKREARQVAADRRRADEADQANFQLFVTRQADLAGVDLSRKQMIGFFLQGKNFAGANLSGANLRTAILRHANLVGANLRDANLRDADLSYANLNQANLEGADLTGATLGYADFSRARMSGSKLVRADLGVATLRADLRHADLRFANLYNADLAPANLARANLRGATLKYATLRGAILRGADLRASQLEGVNFSHVQFDWLTRWPKTFPHKGCPRSSKGGCEFPEAASSGAREAYPERLKEFRRLLVRHLPSGWRNIPDPFGITLESPGEDAHLYAESVAYDGTAKEYADEYEQDFKLNYPGFRQYQFMPITMLGGRPAYMRRYGAEGDKFPFENYIDVYYVEQGRGYVFVLTSYSQGWPLFQRDFRKILNTLRVKPDLFPKLGDG